MTAHHSLRCIPCMKKHERQWLLSAFHNRDGHRDSSLILWRNVEVIGETKTGTPICACKSCGHRYKSMSSAALRALKWRKALGELP